MGRACFPTILLVSFLMLLFFSHGFGRSLRTEDSSVEIKEESGGVIAREMSETMDYADPEPNTNPRAGYIFSPPPK